MTTVHYSPRAARWASLVAVLLLTAAACAPAAPPPAPTAAPKPTSAPAATAAPNPATAPAAQPAAKPTAAAAPAGQPTAASATVTFPKPEKTSLKLGLSAEGVASITDIVTKGLNIYAKYGLDVQQIKFQGAAPAAQALIAGQIDAADNSAGPVISSVATDAPTVMVSVTRHNITDIIAARPDVKTPADLKGKAFAISSFGSQSHATALLALKQWGMTDKDVTLTPVGDDTQRLAALKAGSVAAATQKGPLKQQLQEQGLNILIDLGTVKAPGVPRTGIVVSREFMQKYPNTTLALVAAHIDGLNEFFKQKDKAAELLAKDADIPLKTAQQQIDAEVGLAWDPKDGRPQAEPFDYAKQLLVATNPAMANVDASKAYTTEYIDKLQQMGFFKQLGIATS